MQKWEYLHLEASEDRVYIVADERRMDWEGRSLHEVLNMLGEQGWELVALAFEQHILLPGHLLFKRPK